MTAEKKGVVRRGKLKLLDVKLNWYWKNLNGFPGENTKEFRKSKYSQWKNMAIESIFLKKQQNGKNIGTCPLSQSELLNSEKTDKRFEK